MMIQDCRCLQFMVCSVSEFRFPLFVIGRARCSYQGGINDSPLPHRRARYAEVGCTDLKDLIAERLEVE